MTRKIMVVTGTRAEFGLLRGLMADISETPGLELQVIATGMHLSAKFGMTYSEIEEAGFFIDMKVDMSLEGDSAEDISKSIGVGMFGFADAYKQLEPDMIVVLGDRFELLSAVISALIARIPVAHLHGGETTEGAFDEAIRHSITKMSHLHFVGADEYRNRVIQLGESPERVFMVGGLGVDAIKRTKLLTRTAVEKALGFSFGKRNLLITFHPVTLEEATSELQMIELLTALNKLKQTNLIFTMPNSDTGNSKLIKLVNDFVSVNPNARAYSSLGQLRYLSCMLFVDGVVGNSSSGLAEAPTMKIGTVNMGDRQKGRLMADSVISCQPERGAIGEAINKLYCPHFIESLGDVKNPYGDGGAGKKIVSVIKTIELNDIVKKSFYDFSDFRQLLEAKKSSGF
jgi:GDP/UDP-N,N'-diacetylbacillosamine 2-epimerase (hydrolysing)